MSDGIWNRSRKIPGYILALGVIALGIIARFCWLDADPPLYFSGTSKALLTDPYNVIHFARNKVIFGDWDVFDFQRWVIFKYSLSSAFSYLVFLLGGVSRVTANLSAAVLNLAGILLFVFSPWKRSRISYLIAGVLLLTNVTLLVYGQYPFLENGLIFLCCLLYFLFIRYYPRDWMLILSGLMISLCVLSGKLFGIVMIGPIGLIIWLDSRHKFVRRFGLVLVSLLLSTASLSLIFYGRNIETVYGYLTEQTVGMYGTPHALTSLASFVERFLTFGGTSNLYYYSPLLLVMLFIGLTSLILSSDGLKRIKENRALAFNIGWFLFGFALLMIFNYQPLRYQLFLILPISGIISDVLFKPSRWKSGSRPGFLRAVLLFTVCWYFAVQIGIFVVTYILDSIARFSIAWYVIVPAAVLSAGLIVFRRSYLRASKYKNFVFAALLLFYVVHQSIWIYKWHDKKSYCLKEAGEDLAEIVSHDAIIAGPYGSALTIDSNLKSFIYMFGLSRKEPDLFARFPITHLAIDVNNARLAIEDFPWIGELPVISQYWARDVKIMISRVNDTAIGRPKVNYGLTDYEKAATFSAATGSADSTLYYATGFLNAYPQSKSGLSLLTNHYFKQGRTPKGFETLYKLLSLYPRDFGLYFEKARLLYDYHFLSGDEKFLYEAERFFQKAKSLNPYLNDDIVKAKKRAASRYR